MGNNETQNNGHLKLEIGGQWGRVGEWRMRRGVKRLRLRVPLPLERKLDQRFHFAALSVRGEKSETPSRQWQAIRETTHRPWSILARRLVEAKQAGASREVVEAFALALRDWVTNDLYSTSTPNDGDTPKRAA